MLTPYGQRSYNDVTNNGFMANYASLPDKVRTAFEQEIKDLRHDGLSAVITGINNASFSAAADAWDKQWAGWGVVGNLVAVVGTVVQFVPAVRAITVGGRIGVWVLTEAAASKLNVFGVAVNGTGGAIAAGAGYQQNLNKPGSTPAESFAAGIKDPMKQAVNNARDDDRNPKVIRELAAPLYEINADSKNTWALNDTAWRNRQRLIINTLFHGLPDSVLEDSHISNPIEQTVKSAVEDLYTVSLKVFRQWAGDLAQKGWDEAPPKIVASSAGAVITKDTTSMHALVAKYTTPVKVAIRVRNSKDFIDWKATNQVVAGIPGV